MNNPYEKGGIIASVVILVTVLSIGVVNEYNGFSHGWKDVIDGGMHDMMNTSYDIDNGIHDYIDGGFEKEWTKHVPPPQKPDYNSYYHDNQVTMKCKALASDLQEFSDCVNLGFICVEWDNRMKCTLTSGDGGFGSGSGSGSHP